MKRLLVTLHIYYHNQIEWFISRLSNISGCEWDLLVTYSEPNSSTETKIKAFKPDAIFLQTENTGYDVWPFIKAARQTDLSRYSYIMKLHTKNIDSFKWKINGLKLKGEKWRNLLVDAMLLNEKRFLKCLDLLEYDKNIGMICSRELYVSPSNKHPEDTYMLIEEAKKIGICTERVKFCAGTMFIVRPECITKIINSQIDSNYWKESCQSHYGATPAHIYERLFAAATVDAGYNIKTITSHFFSGLKVSIHKVLSPILKSLINIDYTDEGKKHLIVLGIKVKEI